MVPQRLTERTRRHTTTILLILALLLQPTVASLRRRQEPQQDPEQQELLFDDYRPFKEHLAEGLSLTSQDNPAHQQQHTISLVQLCFENVLAGSSTNGSSSAPLVVSNHNISTQYAAARECHIHRPINDGMADYRPSHQLIVQPTTVAQAAALVRCVAVQDTHITIAARSGAHGFTGDACRGQVILDLAQLEGGVQVTGTPQQQQHPTVTWSAGLLHGQVYDRLWSQHRLVLPGGAEMMVGTGGLWLGCGRGRLANVYGMTCEHLRGIEYIDATGNVQWANATENADMFWMARGGGGTFPGIVTKFQAQVYPMEKDLVFNEKCSFQNTPMNVKALVRTYLDHLDDINDSSRQTFVALSVFRLEAGFKFLCFGCSLEKLRELQTFKDALLKSVHEISPTAVAQCHDQYHSYEGYMLHETTWDDYVTTDDFQKRSVWPKWLNVRENMLSSTPAHDPHRSLRWQFYGDNAGGPAFNGGMLVPKNFTTTDAFVDELVAYTQHLPGDAEERAWKDYFAIYGTGFQTDIGSVASNAVQSHAVIHFKQDKVTSRIAEHQANMNAFERALVERHGLPCRGFYNYFDEDIGCATTENEKLAALYSDPERVKEIVRARDPKGVFFRLFLQTPE